MTDVRTITAESLTIYLHATKLIGIKITWLSDSNLHKIFVIDSETRRVLIETIMPRVPLMIACCVQLAAKMNSADTYNSASLIRIALLTKGVSYTTEEIVLTEADIFKTLGK